jgi:hypothetical protein
VDVEVVIYRNIKGDFQHKAFKWWKSFASLLGFMLDEHVTKNTSTITVYRREEAATFTIFHSESESQLCLDYLRLQPADPKLVKLIDGLIQHMSLSGEKHIIDESVRTSTFFNGGKVVNADLSNDLSKFELLLIRETIFGFIHLSLDRMIEFQQSGNSERLAEVLKNISHYQKWLDKLNEQINSK